LRLKKTEAQGDDRRSDNKDKKDLLPDELHPQPAAVYKMQWRFIADENLRDNVAYQMQYLEFLVILYNEYRIYLTIESLLCKEILTNVAAIVEAVLTDAIRAARKTGGLPIDNRMDFNAILGAAYHEYKLLDKDAWHYFHELRKVRNFLHLTAADFKEHQAYTVEETNEALRRLYALRDALASKPDYV